MFGAGGFLTEAACIAVMLAASAAISLHGEHGDTPEWRKVGRAREALRQRRRRRIACDVGEALLEDGQRERYGTAPNRL